MGRSSCWHPSMAQAPLFSASLSLSDGSCPRGTPWTLHLQGAAVLGAAIWPSVRPFWEDSHCLICFKLCLHPRTSSPSAKGQLEPGPAASCAGQKGTCPAPALCWLPSLQGAPVSHLQGVSLGALSSLPSALNLAISSTLRGQSE